MELIGRLIQIMPLQTGTSKAGNAWEKQDFIIETLEQFPRKIYITSFGKKNVNIESVTIGTELSVTIQIESNEYNGKWFTQVKCLTITMDEESMPAEVEPEPDFTPEETNVEYSDDLPF